MGDRTVQSQPSTSKNNKTNTNKLELNHKLKVLCLHGYRQNADSFRSKLGSFRKFVNKYAEFTFITAPHQAPPLDGTPEGTDISDQKSWWFNKDDGTFKGTNVGGPAVGFEESLKLVEKVWKEEGPFHGLLGFSQGACFAGLLCGIAEKGLTSVRPKFVILAAGFPSGSLVHKKFCEETITIPSLHMYGETDEIIPAKLSQMLSSKFKDAVTITHSGGHYFPATSQQKQAYVNFFRERLQIIQIDLSCNSKTDTDSEEKES